ncbi:MAG: hypothetical protein NXI16_15565 [Alphaproteobacteria bacterium]|nr:hypothetical protein [Alphaproteobacteria bacterium]
MTQPKPRVLKSINGAGETLCVDVFERPDGSFGFEEYRRDPEDGRGWFPVGRHGALRFDSASVAFAEACLRVAWLDHDLEDGL